MISFSEDVFINFMADGSASESTTLCFDQGCSATLESICQASGHTAFQKLEVLSMDWKGTAFATDLPVMLKRISQTATLYRRRKNPRIDLAVSGT
jgi:hypothetical protein